MGDRFEWTEKCPKCRANIEVWYAESCGVTTVTCRKCLTLFNIVMGFRLIESSGEQAEPKKPIPLTDEERRKMKRFLQKACEHCEERLFGGDDCEGVITKGPLAQCYVGKQALRALIESSVEQAEPEKATPPTEERREMVRMVDFVIHTEMCGYFGNGQADEQDKEIIRTVKLWQKIRALILAPLEPAKVSGEWVRKFTVVCPSEYSAGIRGYSDEIVVSVKSGDPGGDEGEFEDFILCSLKEWHDGCGIAVADDNEEEGNNA